MGTRGYWGKNGNELMDLHDGRASGGFDRTKERKLCPNPAEHENERH